MRPVRVNFSAGRLERGMPMTVSYVGSGTVRRKTERRSLNRQSRKTETMNTKAEIQTMLAAYTARYPDERAAMEPFVRYVASFDGDSRVVIDRAESDGFRWVTLDELASMPDFRRVAPKIRAALSEREIAF